MPVGASSSGIAANSTCTPPAFRGEGEGGGLNRDCVRSPALLALTMGSHTIRGLIRKGDRQRMKKTLLTAVASLVLTVAASAGPAKTDAFSITLPEGFGEFTAQSQKTDSPEGKIDTTNWISKAPTGEAVVVTVSTMPAPITDAGKAMAGMRESLLKSLNATLENEEKIDERTANLLFKGSGAFLRSKLLVDGNRMVQVLYVGRSEEQRGAAAVGEIFSSFRASEAPAAEGAAATTSAR